MLGRMIGIMRPRLSLAAVFFVVACSTMDNATSAPPNNVTSAPSAMTADCNETTTTTLQSGNNQFVTTVYYAILDTDKYWRPVLVCGVENFGTDPECPVDFSCTDAASDPVLLGDECEVRFGRPAGTKMAVRCGNRLDRTIDGITTVSGQRALTVAELDVD